MPPSLPRVSACEYISREEKWAYRAKRFVQFVLAFVIGLTLLVCWMLVQSKRRIDDVADQVEKVAQVKQLTAPTMSLSGGAGSTSPAQSTLSNQTSAQGYAPPENTPLVSIWKSLRDRADGGDAYASCRLAMELLRCRIYESSGVAKAAQNSRRLELALRNPNTTEQDWKRINAIHDKYKVVNAVCSGFHNHESISSDAYLLKAALLGHEGAMEMVATMPPLELIAGSMNFDLVLARREHATTFLNELVSRGNLTALSHQAFTHAGEAWWSQLGLKGEPSISYAEAAVYARAADVLELHRRATFPRGSDSPTPFSLVKFLSLDKHLSAAELQVAEEKANALLGSLPPSAIEAEAQKAPASDIQPGADSRVVRCRAR